jgi:A/G-specific adenine glycosylase
MLFSQQVVRWQREKGRHHLPWMGQSAYHVWLSEVMLQQTQVATVLSYYAAFIHAFPSVRALAAASIDDVLARWAGLGYYSRARHLHQCAQLIVTQYGGVFPCELAALQALPGIGPSTAAAIASLALGQRAAILDGNVKRVLARHAGVQGWPGMPSIAKSLWALAQERLVPDNVAVSADFHQRYTQGMMDLGATICTNKQAKCHACPIAVDCYALKHQLVSSIPASRPKKQIPTQERCALVLHTAQGVWLERRIASGLWGGLLCLPEAQSEQDLERVARELGLVQRLKPWHVHQLKHTFTHYQLHWHIWSVTVEDSFELPAPWVFAAWDAVARVGVPKAVLKVLGSSPY